MGRTDGNQKKRGVEDAEGREQGWLWSGRQAQSTHTGHSIWTMLLLLLLHRLSPESDRINSNGKIETIVMKNTTEIILVIRKSNSVGSSV